MPRFSTTITEFYGILQNFADHVYFIPNHIRVIRVVSTLFPFHPGTKKFKLYIPATDINIMPQYERTI